MQNLIVRSSLALGIGLLASIPVTAASATQPADTSTAVAQGESTTLLVLPFHEVAAANYAWVGKAIQQDLLADLTRASRAKVEAPSAAPPAEDTAAALSAGKQSGAELVVYGQFQTVGGQMRITGQVLSIPTGQPLGSISATGAMNDLFPLEDTVSGQVLRALPAGLLVVALPAGAQDAPPTTTAPSSFVPAPMAQQVTASKSDASPQYYSYTYPDYSAGPPSTNANAYYNSPYYYGYPYYWYATPFYGPDIFFFYGRDRFHHHSHDWGHSDHWHHDGLRDFAGSGRAGPVGVSHAPAARSSSGGGSFRLVGGGGGGFHAGGGHH